MARKALIDKKNQKRIKKVNRFAQKRAALKDAAYRKDISLAERCSLLRKLNKLPRDSSRVRVRNICFITGRTRGVYRKFGISRHQIRHLAGMMLIPGLTKSSW